MGMMAFASTESLSDALRERTAALHIRAERTGIINDILRKMAGKDSYALLLRNLHPAYCAMERSFKRRQANDVLGVFADPALHRADNMAHDLEALCGKTWPQALELLPAGERYAASVAAAGEGDGVRLVAHAYVRYFGDLSGGQVLKRLLGESMGLPPSSLTFYDFPGIEDTKAFKDGMRRAIDGEAMAFADVDIILDEGVRAFEHNIEISLAVQALASA